MVGGRHIRLSTPDLIFTLLNYLFLGAWLFVILWPLLFIISASFSDPAAVDAGQVWLLPVRPRLDGYAAVFRYQEVWSGYANSLFYAVVGTTVNLVMTIAAAYPLSRKNFFGRNLFMAIFAFTMFFSGGLIPFYLVVRGLGLLNTRAAMIIPTALSVWNVIIARTFFQNTIPSELLESAQMEGCTDLRFIRSIVVPLSGPILAVLALFYAVGHWNSYFNALIFLNDPNKFPLQIILRKILVMNQTDWKTPFVNVANVHKREELQRLLKYSLIIVASAPVLMIYPFAQRYFVKGVMIGALKG